MRHASITYQALRVAARGFAATALLVIIFVAGTSAAIIAQADRRETRRADAILVMGAAQWNGRPSPALRARLDSALTLYRRGFASRIILTGSAAPGDQYSEAAVARTYLIERGVDPGVLLIEEQGASTLSSLRAAVTIARAEGIKSVILVTDPYHQLRALKIARDHGLQTYAEPVRDSTPTSTVARAGSIAREAWAYLGYVLLGR